MAVIGSGVAGLGAAWALSRLHDVTLFESEDRLGGHAHTVDVEDVDGPVPVDTGFIVFNPPTYPNLVAWFRAMGVPTEPSDMSFSVSAGMGAFEYQARLAGLAAQPRNLASPAYLGMIRDIVRFCRTAEARAGDESVGSFLARERYGPLFRDGFLLPMIGCIWSSKLAAMLDYPAATLVRFLGNHGLLALGRRPRWRTVTGGSRVYVDRAVRGPVRVRTGSPIVELRRDPDGVTLRAASGERTSVDHVVLATHADTTLAILGDDATDAERGVLGAFRFQENRAVLHRDPRLMPVRRRVWSSWNYLAADPIGARESPRVSLSYWMNRLQNLRTAEPVVVTLNPQREPRGWSRSFVYHHPVFDGRAVDAQRSLEDLQGRDRAWFAGAWTGYGFHEDGLRSGLGVAAALGAPAPWTGAPRGVDEVVAPAERRVPEAIGA